MGHNCVLFTLHVVLAYLFILVLVFNGQTYNPGGTNLFVSISDKYYIEITPEGWTFGIWGFIYTWQAIWILYSIINLFRSTDSGPAYTLPVIFPVPFLVSYSINMLLNCSWVILFGIEILEAALAVLFAMCVTLYICLCYSYRYLDAGIGTLIKQGRKKDIWLTRMLVQNGISLYATWCTIATLLNLAMVIAYRSANDVDQQDASTISLSILSLEIVIFLIADLIFLDRYTRYTFTPYIVFVVALIGSLAKNYEGGARNTIFTIVLLAVAGGATLKKFFLLVWRHINYGSTGPRME